MTNVIPVKLLFIGFFALAIGGFLVPLLQAMFLRGTATVGEAVSKSQTPAAELAGSVNAKMSTAGKILLGAVRILLFVLGVLLVSVYVFGFWGINLLNEF